MSAVLLALVAPLVGAAGVQAAEPSLGASVQTVVYLSDGGRLQVISLSTVPVRVTFTGRDGWEASPTEVVLQPDEMVEVQVTGTGLDGGHVDVEVTEVAPVAVGARSVLAFAARIYEQRPFDPAPWVLGALALLAVLIGTGLMIRRLPRYTFRIERRS